MVFNLNLDVEPRVEAALALTSADWVLNEQPVLWHRHSAWHRQWMRDPSLPHAEVLDQLAREMDEHGRVRRRFVPGYAEHNTPLLIAAMAWGYGDSNRGPARARRAITTCKEDLDAYRSGER